MEAFEIYIYLRMLRTFSLKRLINEQVLTPRHHKTHKSHWMCVPQMLHLPHFSVTGSSMPIMHSSPTRLAMFLASKCICIKQTNRLTLISDFLLFLFYVLHLYAT